MSDGITLNSGSGGATLATDDAGVAGHVQVVKLAIATDGSATAIPADGTDGLLVNLGSNNDVTIADGGNSITVDGTVTAAQGTAANLNATVVGTGTFAVQAAQSGTWTVQPGNTANTTAWKVDASSVAVPVTDNAGSLTVDNAGLTSLNGAISGSEVQVDVVGALPAGTNAIGKLAANSGVDIGDVDVTSIAAGTNSIGNVGLIGRTTGGMSIFRSLDIDETEEEIKATAGQVFSIAAFNRTAAPLYLKFYNATAANVTVGSTTPVLTFVVPANADSDGAGFIWNNEIGFAFGTAISVAATTGVADNDTGAPGANDCVINIGYV